MSINSDYNIPQIPVWMKGMAYASTTALTVSVVVLTALLTIYPQMGVIAFSVAASAAGLSFILSAVSIYLINRKMLEELPPSQVEPGETTEPVQPPLARISHQISDNSHTLSRHLVPQQGGSVLHEHCPHPAVNQSAATGERFVQRSGEKYGLEDPVIEDDEPTETEPLIEEQVENLEVIPEPQPSIEDEVENSTSSEEEPVPLSSEFDEFIDIDVQAPNSTVAEITDPLKYIDDLHKSLPALLKQAKIFCLVFIDKYHKSEGKKNTEKATAQTIKDSFKSLTKIVKGLFEDKRHLARFALEELIISYINHNKVSKDLGTQNIRQFVNDLPNCLIPLDTELDDLASIRQMFKTITERAQIRQKTLFPLYKDLQLAARRYPCEEKYICALIKFFEELIFSCKQGEFPFDNSIANTVTTKINVLLSNYVSGFLSLIQDEKRLLSIKDTLSTYHSMIKFANKVPFGLGMDAVRQAIKSDIESLPIHQTTADKLLNELIKLIPVLIDPAYYVSVGKHTYSTVARNHIFNAPGFASLPHDPENPTPRGALSKKLNELTAQFENLSFGT